MPYRLSKHTFLNSARCPRLGWFSRQATPPVELAPRQTTVADRFPADEQREVHDRARILFPEATRVSRQAFEAACWQTQDLLDRASTSAILEAAFGTSTCRARADALVRTGETWCLYSIRACASSTSELVDELAYDWMVLDAAGVNLGGAILLLLSSDHRVGMPDYSLFTPLDVTAVVASRAEEFGPSVTSLDAFTHAPEPPAARLIPHCRKCPLFRTCTGAGIRHPLFELPHLTARQLHKLLELGYQEVTDIPDRTLLTERQSTVWRSITNDQLAVTDDLRGHFDAVAWPAYYLDFETAATAIPLFPDIAPLERFPFLYSVRTCDRPGGMQSHRAFLSPHERAGARELAQRLLQDLGSEGSIIVYSGYETRTIRWLACRHPDIAGPLRELLRRIVVLESVVRRNIYHPGFHGSTSLRAVLPALVPGFTYIDLEIEDAASASASYAYLAKGGYYSAARAPLIRRDLYAYCARDTLALVRLHEALWHIAEGR